MAKNQFMIDLYFTDGDRGNLSMGMKDASDYAQAKSFLEQILINSPDYEKQGLYFVTQAQYEEFMTARAKWNGWRR
jgi:hypothetical protein